MQEDHGMAAGQVRQMNSEVARLMRQIDLEVEACNRIFRDPAITATHASIQKRMEHIGNIQNELTRYLPSDTAAELIIEALGHLDRSGQADVSIPSSAASTKQRVTAPDPSSENVSLGLRPNLLLTGERQKRGWSKHIAAKHVGVSDLAYRTWEAGRRVPTFLHLKQLCRAFQLSPEQLGFSTYDPSTVSPEAQPGEYEAC